MLMRCPSVCWLVRMIALGHPGLLFEEPESLPDTV